MKRFNKVKLKKLRTKRKKIKRKRKIDSGKKRVRNTYESVCEYKSVTTNTLDDDKDKKKIKKDNTEQWKQQLGFDDLVANSQDVELIYSQPESKNLKTVKVDFTKHPNTFDINRFSYDFMMKIEKMEKEMEKMKKETIELKEFKNKNQNTKRDVDYLSYKMQEKDKEKDEKDDEIKDIKKKLLKKDNEMIEKDNQIQTLTNNLSKLKIKIKPMSYSMDHNCLETFNIVLEQYLRTVGYVRDLTPQIINDTITKYNYSDLNWDKIFDLRTYRNNVITHTKNLDRLKVQSAIEVYEQNNWKELKPMYKLAQHWMVKNPK